MNVAMLARRIRLLAAVTLATQMAAPALAWNDAGHMAVAYVAYQQLTPAKRARVKQLLKLNPDYGRWLPKGTAAKDRDLVRFMIAATWPDDIKSKATYHDDGSHNGDRPDGASSRRNTGYTDRLRHKYWHFVDTPFSTDNATLPAVPRPNAQTQIAAFRAVLASTKADALKSYDLVWLLHLVGDVHQPLHCATRVRQSELDGDNGGNRVTVQCADCPNNLHAFWDDAFAPNSASVGAVIAAAQALPAPDATLAAKSDANDWIAESFQTAQQKVYVAPVGGDGGPFTLTDAYANAARAVANARIGLAGARLAHLLSTELK